MIIASLRRSFFFLLTLVLGGCAILVFWLSHSPIPLKFLNTYFKENYAKNALDLEATELVWTVHGPTLHFQNAQLKWSSGELYFKDAYFSPSLWAALKGKFRLSFVRVVDPVLSLDLNGPKDESAAEPFDMATTLYFLKHVDIERAAVRIKYDQFLHGIPLVDYHFMRQKDHLKGEGRFVDDGHIFSSFNFNFINDTGLLDVDLQKYHLKNDANMNMQNIVVSLKTALSIDLHKGTALNVKADIANFDVSQLKNDWPATLAPGARNWVLNHIHEGTLSKTHFQLAAVGKDLSALKAKNLKGTFGFEGLKLTYHPGFKAIDHVNGTGLITPKDITFHLTSGTTDNLNIPAGNVKIDWSGKKETIAIRTRIKGALKDTLKLIENEPLQYPQKIGLNPSDFEGQANVEYIMTFPLVKDLYVDDMEIYAKANLSNVHYKKKMLGGFLASPNITLETDKHNLKISGPATLNKLPFTFTYGNMYDAPYSNKLDVASSFGPSFDALLTIPFTQFEGPFHLTAAHKKSDDHLVWSVNVNADKSTFALPAFHYKKVPQTPFQFKGTVALSPDQEIQNIAFRGENQKEFLAGTVQFKNSTPQKLDVDVKLGFNDFHLGYQRVGATASKVNIAGKRLDFQDFLSEMMGGDESASKENLDLTYTLAALRMNESRAFKRTVGMATLKGPLLSKLKFNGALEDGGALDLSITPEPGLKKRLISMASTNAGSVLKTLGILPNMLGGVLHVSGAYDDNLANHPLLAEVNVKDYALNEMPLMVKILSLISFSPFEWQQKKGMAFRTLKGTLLQNRNIWTLKNMMAKGAALSISLGGTVDTLSKKISLRGDIAPQNFLNQGLGKIPLLGKLLTGSKESGIIAARFGIAGTLETPKIWANPLSPFTPGILREIF